MGMKETAVTAAKSLQSTSTHSSISTLKSATIADIGYDVDVLTQFKSNLNQLEDLSQRLKFVLGDVQTLIKRK